MKNDHDHYKYINTPEFNKLTAENVSATLAQANVASKNYIADLVKRTDFHDKLKNLKKRVISNKSRHSLVEHELQKLQIFDSSYFIGQRYFFNDGAQLHLIFQTLFYTLKRLGDTENGNLKVCWPKNLILLFKLWII